MKGTKLLFFAVLICLFVLTAAGCGNNSAPSTPNSSSSAKQAQDPGAGSTDPTDSTGAVQSDDSTGGNQSSNSSSKTSESNSKKKKQSSSATGKQHKKSSSDDQESSVHENSDEQTVSEGTDRLVANAANAMEAAIQKKDVDFLCTVSYSTDYVKVLGGVEKCKSKTTRDLAKFTEHEMKIVRIGYMSPTDSSVNVRFRFVSNGKTTTSEPVLSFKLDGGRWRYYIRTAQSP